MIALLDFDFCPRPSSSTGVFLFLFKNIDDAEWSITNEGRGQTCFRTGDIGSSHKIVLGT